MKGTPFSALMVTVVIATMCVMSIGAVEFFGNADVPQKVLWPFIAMWAAWRGSMSVLREAIAGEARNGETVQQGSTGTASTRAEGIAHTTPPSSGTQS